MVAEHYQTLTDLCDSLSPPAAPWTVGGNKEREAPNQKHLIQRRRSKVNTQFFSFLLYFKTFYSKRKVSHLQHPPSPTSVTVPITSTRLTQSFQSFGALSQAILWDLLLQAGAEGKQTDNKSSPKLLCPHYLSQLWLPVLKWGVDQTDGMHWPLWPEDLFSGRFLLESFIYNTYYMYYLYYNLCSPLSMWFLFLWIITLTTGPSEGDISFLTLRIAKLSGEQKKKW